MLSPSRCFRVTLSFVSFVTISACDHFHAPSANPMAASSRGIGGFAAALTRAQAGAERRAIEAHSLTAAGIPSPSGMPRSSLVPQTTAWMLLTAVGDSREVIEAREDLAAKLPGWWRAGDGSISVKLKTAKGRTIRGQECGGVYVGEANPERGARLLIKNMTDRRIEVVVDWHGRDLLGQGGFPFQRKGLVLRAGQAITIRDGVDPAGKAIPLPCTVITDHETLMRHDPASLPGVVRLSVFQSTDRIQNTPTINHRLPAGAAQRAAEPRARSYEYR